MNTSVVFDCNAPPPTFNTLDTRQKSRLIRSTRKLSEVLGTTPQLIDICSPISPSDSPITRKPPPFSSRKHRKRREGSIFKFPLPSAPFTYDYGSSSASSSVSSLALPRGSLESSESDVSTCSLPNFPAPKSFATHVREKSQSKGKCALLPTPLVLRLNAVPLPPSDPRVQLPITSEPALTLSTPNLSAATPPPITPITPMTPATPTPTETRRKRLAKLKRTLGENIPQELIMPFRLRVQQSSPTSPVAAPPQKRPELLAAQQHQYASVRMPSQEEKMAPAKGGRRRSVSVDFGHGVEASAPWRSPQTPSERTRFPAAEQGLIQTHERRSSRVWVTGAGTWTGEWNRKDIREVQQQLRRLR